MSRIVLIHGFATGIRYSVFRAAHGADAGFSAFRDDIESGEASIFRWDIKEEASFFQSLNPFYSWGVYRREAAIVKDPETHRRLAEFLLSEQPEIILCHSMGCFLFSEYLKNENLPPSMHQVIFNQADFPRSLVLHGIEDRARSGALSITNTFCFWDPTLWFAALMRGSLRAGLVGMWNSLVRNRFFSLLKPINLHTSAIRSRSFRDWCFSFLG